MPDFRTPLNRTRALEWMLTTLLIVWSVQMIRMDPTDVPDTYQILVALMKPVHWGTAGVIVAMFRLAALYVNGWWRRTPIIRFLGCAAGGMFWMAIGFLQYATAARGVDLSPGVAYYAVYLVFEGWCAVSTGYDVHREGALGMRARKRHDPR
jgi:hypothetical protein